MDAIQILADVGIHLRQWRRGQHYMPCPRCKTKKTDQHLSVFVTPEGHALWKCWRCGDFSGSTAAIARKLEWEARQKSGPGVTRSLEKSPMKKKVETEPRTVSPVKPVDGPVAEHVPFEPRHATFWDTLDPITNSCPVGRYLTGRGCPVPPSADLRWHPDFGYLRPNSNWRGPVMVGLITSVLTAEPMSFHFTWVRPDGHGKAPLERPRLLARGMSKQGGVIRLCDDAELGSWLMVGEGIETMLTAQKMTGFQQAWSCIDAGNLAQMPLPPWLLSVTIVADHDKVARTGVRPGLKAADDLVERCTRSSTVHSIEVVYPLAEGTDLNDLARDLDHRDAESVA